MKRIVSVFFSPTGGTRRCAAAVSRGIANAAALPVEEINITLPGIRAADFCFSDDDIVVLAVPTYAGRVPNKIMPDLAKHLHGSGKTPLIAVSVYGNRSAGECLRELVLSMEQNGFTAVAGAECVAEHAFCRSLATGRPDENDVAELTAFGEIAGKKALAVPLIPMELDRQTPLAPYYTPRRADGTPAVFLKAKPKTHTDMCIHCGACAEHCPMGSIAEDCVTVTGVCIKCQACVKICAHGAKYFDDEAFLSHRQMLAENYTGRKENKFYY